MAKTIYQQLKEGASAQSIRDTFWSKITETTNKMRNDLGVDLWSADIIKQMKQELDDEITRAESRINKENNEALENKRKELINSCIDYLAAVAHDDDILELKGDKAFEMFYPMLAPIEKNFISTWGAEKAKSQNKIKASPDETLHRWLKYL